MTEKSLTDWNSIFMKIGRSLMIRLLTIDPNSVRADVRGFRADNQRTTELLELIGEVFLHGYHRGLKSENGLQLQTQLESVPIVHRGFAYEGAAMGLGIRDIIFGKRWKRVSDFLEQVASKHRYLVHVGVGWAIAAVPWTRWRVSRALVGLDPLLKWLAFDGFGFYHGYFGWRKSIDKQKRYHRLSAYEGRVFDQGLGRSLWFVEGADAPSIARRIAQFAPQRREDMWSGVGLACAYAGGATKDSILFLKDVARPYRTALAQGAAFAAKARVLAGNIASHTETSCEILCGMNASQAAHLTDAALEDVDLSQRVPLYEQWRKLIQKRLGDSSRHVVANIESNKSENHEIRQVY